MSETDPQPLIDVLRAQRNAALDTIADLYATIHVLQSKIDALEKEKKSGADTGC